MADHNENTPIKKKPPAMTAEARESQLVGYAYDLAEDLIRSGRASSQVITHFLKLGTAREKKELEILESQRVLIQAKTESIKSAKKVEELMTEALSAMRSYSGGSERDDEEE